MKFWLKSNKKELSNFRLTYQEKLKLSTDVRELTQIQLGEVVKIIKQNAPNSYKEVDKENCQIVVDNMTRTTFDKLNE